MRRRPLQLPHMTNGLPSRARARKGDHLVTVSLFCVRPIALGRRDRARSLADHIEHHIRLREYRNMAGGGFGRGSLHPLCREALQLGVNRAVLGGNDVPARLVFHATPGPRRNGTPTKGRWGGSMSMSAAAKKYRWRTYTPSRLWAACRTSSWRGVGTFKPCCAVTLASNIGSSGWLGVSPGERRHGDGRSHGAPTFRARRP